MFRLPKSASLEQSDGFVAALEDGDRRPDLQVPSSVRGINLGGQAAAVQSVISWARRFPGAAAHLYVDELTSSHLRQPHLLTAILMAGQVRALGGTDCTRRARQLALERLSESGQRLDTGSAISITAADHTSYASPPLLYARRGDGRAQVRRPSELGHTLHQVLERQNFAIAPRGIPQLAETLAGLTYELFDNTSRHARTATDGRTLSPSVRMVLMRGVLSPLAELQKSQPPDSPLGVYTARPELTSEREGARLHGMRRFVELSVVDSGEGMPERASLSGIKFARPVDAVAWCLNKNLGTTFASWRGGGLVEVMRLLTEARGFIRIRTGSVEFSRDFVISPVLDAEYDDRHFQPRTWIVRQASDGIPPAAGTVVTILLPFDALGGTA